MKGLVNLKEKPCQPETKLNMIVFLYLLGLINNGSCNYQRWNTWRQCAVFAYGVSMAKTEHA